MDLRDDLPLGDMAENEAVAGAGRANDAIINLSDGGNGGSEDGINGLGSGGYKAEDMADILLARDGSSAKDPSMTTGAMEVDARGAGGAVLHTLALSALNPFTLVLAAYLAVVALQLVLVARSALQGSIKSVLHRPHKVQLLAASALLSLVATWYFMLAYLSWSYHNFLSTIHLAGDELTSLPDCAPDAALECYGALASAHLMRIAQWLRQTSLFEEAWLHVVSGKRNWWWSVEVCTFTVGVWALYLRVQGARYAVPHVWAYMLLGQTCGISVAMNLFAVALAVRAAPSGAAATRSPLARTDSQRLMPPPAAPAGGTRRSSTRGGLTVFVPSLAARIIVLVLALGGLYSVYLKPSSLATILAMHVGPMLIALPLLSMLQPLSSARSALERYISLPAIYGLVALITLAIRLRAHQDILDTAPAHLWHALISHPAQSSISMDAVCITLSVMVVLFDYARTASAARAERNESVTLHIVRWLLVVLTPILGPSVTLAAALFVDESRYEDEDSSSTSSRPASPAKTPRASASSSSPFKDRIMEALAERSPAADANRAAPPSASKKTSPAKKRTSKTEAAKDSATESASEASKAPSQSSSVKKKAASGAAKATKPRAKRSAAEPGTTTDAGTDDEATAASTATASKSASASTRKRAAPQTNRGGGTRSHKVSTTGDSVASAASTDTEGPSTRTRKQATPSRRRGGGRRKAAAAE